MCNKKNQLILWFPVFHPQHTESHTKNVYIFMNEIKNQESKAEAVE